MEEGLHKATNEKAFIQESIEKLTRKGHQSKQGRASFEEKKRRSDRVTGKSVESSASEGKISDASSFLSKNNMMEIPEDDIEPAFGGIPLPISPQTALS